MGIRYTRARGAVGGEDYRRLAATLENLIEEELADAGADGVMEGRKIIETSGTGRSWSGPFRDRDGTVRTGSGAGRIASGRMYDAVDFRITRGAGVGLDVGWIHDWDVYFAAQDRGTSATGYRNGGGPIAAMGMMAHLQVYMRDSLERALDRIQERMIDAL